MGHKAQVTVEPRPDGWWAVQTDRTQRVDGPDRSKVSLDTNEDINYWTNRFRVPVAVLRAAVSAAGSKPAAVEVWMIRFGFIKGL